MEEPPDPGRAQLKQLFFEAIDFPPNQREGFIQRLGVEPKIIDELRLLLHAHDEAGSFLEPRHATTSTLRPLQSGKRLGPYEIVDLIGRGGMGVVYRARDTRLGRHVAIKVLRPEFVQDVGRRKRFEDEARAASALNHPNVLTVYDVGTVEDGGGSAFLVMELLEGETLRARLNRQPPLAREQVIDCASQIARGLAAAHAAGMVHRDIKPENLFLTTDGRMKILDFGVAKLTASADVPRIGTASGVIVGTVGYMSPEQVRGQAVDQRADIFAFGAVLYEMLTGARAFHGESAADTLSATLNTSASDLSPSVDTLPKGLASIVRRCLEKSAEERFQTGDELSDAMTQANASASAPARRATLVASVAAIAIVTGAGTSWWWIDGVQRPQSTAFRSTQPDSPLVVAVVPFDSIADDTSRQYVADGMTEEITAQLSRLATLRVMSRAAVARYTDSPSSLRRLAPELGVRSIITGSVRLAGAHARIGVQLVDAKSDQTLWSEQYDRDLQDILAVQSDVARQIAIALQGRLTTVEQQKLTKPPTENARAYELYLQSRPLTTLEARQNASAIELLREAIRLDPHFSLAYAQLARRQAFLAQTDGRRHLAEAMTLAQKAVEIDPSEARAHYALGTVHLNQGAVGKARLSLLRATELDPSLDVALDDLSVVEQWVGHFDQSLHWARRGFQLAPNSAVSYYHLAGPLLALAADAAAERWLTEAERRFPQFQRIQIVLGALELLTGRTAPAFARIERTVDANPDAPEGKLALAEFAVLTDAPDAVDLVRAVFESSPDTRFATILTETARTVFAYLAAARGDKNASALLDQALASAHEEMRRGSEDPAVPMEIGAIYAIKNDRANAMRWVDTAYRAGNRMYREALVDPLFATIKDDPQFRIIIQQMEGDVTAMRSRVDVDANPRLLPPVSPLP